MYYYPVNFLNEALFSGTGTTNSVFETATGLSGLWGTAAGQAQTSCPTPDFPISMEYRDPTQVFTYATPMLEKRIMTAHRLPRIWSLTYPAILDTELAYLREFYKARKGKWESFYFIDIDRYTFDSAFPTTLGYTPDVVTYEDYVCTARFGNNYKAERMNKNWYNIKFQILEVF